MKRARIDFQLRSWWHAGSGRGEASTVDALIVRDADGLPCLPGKTVKGLLRDAFSQWEYWEQPLGAGCAADSLTIKLFGQRAEVGAGTTRYSNHDGVLRVSSARLTANLRATLSSSAHREALIAEMTGILRSTAIAEETGAAVPHSLRSIEVAVPMRLSCIVEGPATITRPDTDEVIEWVGMLGQAALFLRAVGVHRHRGLGRVEVSVAAAGDSTGAGHG